MLNPTLSTVLGGFQPFHFLLTISKATYEAKLSTEKKNSPLLLLFTSSSQESIAVPSEICGVSAFQILVAISLSSTDHNTTGRVLDLDQKQNPPKKNYELKTNVTERCNSQPTNVILWPKPRRSNSFGEGAIMYVKRGGVVETML